MTAFCFTGNRVKTAMIQASRKKALLIMGKTTLSEQYEALEKEFEILWLYKEKDPERLLQDRRNDIVAIVSVFAMPVSRTLIEALPNLEIIAQYAVGYDNIDLEAARERGIMVTNTPDVLTDDTADTALSLLLAVSRRICEGDMYVRVGKWLNGSMPLGNSLGSKTAGIVGMGRIGQAITSRCAAFGMKILYTGPRKKDGISYDYEPDLEKLAEKADYLILACPGGAKTHHMVHAPILEALGPKGFLVNISRGSVVNEEDLITALKNKKIAGAGLDVFANEPHVPEELIKMDNVVLLPHIGSATVETRAKMGQLVIDNLLAHFDGKPLLTPVT
ncbi:MAG: 2-hydroxyacid dehydrogenase [Micavibrio aeruginosavorus]|uniref:2-hydroxyacid dehydrogenase n=1 Tax=Micavibrio aeruginosavorus TaxID=349221 RepID=A0A2W5MRH3_9BACT|nr:MAG: 2-hydroxyacid dehydrogenase [Micavibrio aeruginosavorus]